MAKSTKLPGVSRVVSTSKFRYGHDPSHYPFKAAFFILRNSILWKKVFCVALCGLTTAFVCIFLLFIFTLKLQAEFIGDLSGTDLTVWWVWLLAVLAVLFEAAILTIPLLYITQSKCQTEIFVTTMRIKNKWNENEMKKQSMISEMNIFCKKMYVIRIITAPMCFIPIFGGALYSCINAAFVGWDYMDMYFDAIDLSRKLQLREVFGDEVSSACSALCKRSTYDDDNEYARFGFIVCFFETLPIVGGTVFPLINACAAALFACDIEESGGPSCLPMKSKMLVPVTGV